MRQYTFLPRAVTSGGPPVLYEGVVVVAPYFQPQHGTYLAGVVIATTNHGGSTQSGNDGVWSLDEAADWTGKFGASKTGWTFVPAPWTQLYGPGGAAGIEFVATPSGLPQTGVTTSYRAGDDGDVQAGTGGLPATGVTTSYRADDDGDIQAGVKG
jgi:hypothetical protein